MKREKLVRDVKMEALARMEAAARTEEDFNAVVAQWDHLDENRERKERAHEIGRREEMYYIGYTDGAVIPPPMQHPYWRELMRGDFISYIYDNAEEMWQVVADWQIGYLVKSLTAKQKEVLFLSAVRLCTSAQIACYQGKTGRAIRKLLAVAFEYIRSNLADRIRSRIRDELPVTKEKRDFLKWYEKQKAALDNDKNG